MTPRTLLAIALVSIVPLWAYSLLGTGAIYEAAVATVSVLVTVGALYTALGPHEGADDAHADAR